MHNNLTDDAWFETAYVNMRYRDYITKKSSLLRFSKSTAAVRLVNKSHFLKKWNVSQSDLCSTRHFNSIENDLKFNLDIFSTYINYVHG